MLSRAAEALGVATLRDLADYFRMSPGETWPRVEELVEEAALHRVEVENWGEPGYLANTAQLPRFAGSPAAEDRIQRRGVGERRLLEEGNHCLHGRPTRRRQAQVQRKTHRCPRGRTHRGFGGRRIGFGIGNRGWRSAGPQACDRHGSRPSSRPDYSLRYPGRLGHISGGRWGPRRSMMPSSG